MRGFPRWMRWAGLALVLLGAALALRESAFTRRYLTVLVTGPSGVPLSFYDPRERIAGVESPDPLPRATAFVAGIEPGALELAAQYAAARNSHALLVTRHGHLVFERYWGGTSFDTLESAHGFVKTLAALAVGLAIAERRIGSLDEPASKYITEWQADERRSISIRDLLQMSSGLEQPSTGALPWSPRMRQFLSTDILPEYLGAPLAGRPGLDWMDRDVDTQMLALLLERATGQRYAEWLSSRLWKPLGAGDAWLWLDRPGGTAHAQCCLVARQGDWLRVAELLLSDGQYQGSRILPAGWVGAMRTSARGNRNYGFQVWLGAPYAAQRAYSPLPGAPTSHSEEAYAADDVMFLDGYGKYRLWVVPSLGLAILRTGTDPADRADWDDSRIPNLIIRGVSDRPQSVPGAHVDLSKIVPGH